jgi:PAS domain S-box-containing protein
MTTQFRVLQIEDSTNDAFFNVRALQSGGFEVRSERVENAEQMRRALEAGPWDFIICDYKLPQFDAFSALALYKEAGLEVPFIAVSGRIGEPQAIKLLKAGAHDCVMKDNLKELPTTVRRELQAAEDRRRRKREIDTEVLLASIVKECREAIFGTTLDGSLVTWNRGAEKLYGYSAAEVIGAPVAILEPPDQPTKQSTILKRLKCGEPVEHFETVHLRKDKSAIEVSVLVSPVKEPKGRLIGASTIVQDITDRKQKEQERFGLIRGLTAALVANSGVVPRPA